MGCLCHHYPDCPCGVPEPKFKIGDRVEKYTGDYSAFGEVRAVYSTKRGRLRYVVEIEPQGFQMIWGDKELRPCA